jgi:SNF2 family DNA or RNA helicase
MATQAWKHQKEAVAFVEALRGRGMVAMEMGTGKTLVALLLLQRWGVRRALILCPKSVVAVWPADFRKHFPELTQTWRVLALDDGTCRQRAEKIASADALATRFGWPLLVVLNYEAATEGPISSKLQTMPWDALVCDECHRLKDPTGKRSKFIARLAQAIPRRLGLTGTPCPHSPLDLWAQFRMIDPRVFGNSYHQFRNRYARMGGYQDKQVVGFVRMDELTQKFHEHAFRVRTEDVLELPPAVDERRYCMLGARARRAYDDFADELVCQIDKGVVTASNALVKLLRLSQFTSGFYADELTGQEAVLGGEKRELLREIIEEVQADAALARAQLNHIGGGAITTREPLVVFGRFHRDLDTAHEVCAELGLTTSELSGRRNELLDWQQGQTDVIVAQLQAGGLGVDLTRARVQVYYSLNYSLGDFMQTRARIHRPGQTRPVLYVHMLAANTIDEVVYAALEKREEVIKAVVDALRGSRGAKMRAQARAQF